MFLFCVCLSEKSEYCLPGHFLLQQDTQFWNKVCLVKVRSLYIGKKRIHVIVLDRPAQVVFVKLSLYCIHHHVIVQYQRLLLVLKGRLLQPGQDWVGIGSDKVAQDTLQIRLCHFLPVKLFCKFYDSLIMSHRYLWFDWHATNVNDSKRHWAFLHFCRN